MSKNQELVKAVECFIQKHQTISGKVKWPEWVFKIVGVEKVKIKEDSLKEFGNLYTFEGSALIAVTDKSRVELKKEYTIIGNASVEFFSDGGKNGEYLPAVKQIEITKIG